MAVPLPQDGAGARRAAEPQPLGRQRPRIPGHGSAPPEHLHREGAPPAQRLPGDEDQDRSVVVAGGFRITTFAIAYVAGVAATPRFQVYGRGTGTAAPATTEFTLSVTAWRGLAGATSTGLGQFSAAGGTTTHQSRGDTVVGAVTPVVSHALIYNAVGLGWAGGTTPRQVVPTPAGFLPGTPRVYVASGGSGGVAMAVSQQIAAVGAQTSPVGGLPFTADVAGVWLSQSIAFTGNPTT